MAFLERIEEDPYGKPEMVKGEAYLSFARHLIKEKKQDEASAFIDKIHDFVFSLEDIENGRETINE